jgi:hypothetical protein
MKKRLGALVGLVMGLSGCAVGPDYHTPDISVPYAFVPPLAQIAQKTAQKPGVDLVEWWQSLRDPELNSLVSRAIESNLDLKIALTRIQAASRPKHESHRKHNRGQVKGLFPDKLPMRLRVIIVSPMGEHTDCRTRGQVPSNITSLPVDQRSYKLRRRGQRSASTNKANPGSRKSEL